MALKQNETILLDIKVNTAELQSKVLDARKAIISLKEENKTLNKQAAEALKNGATASYEELTTKIIQNEAAIRSAQGEQKNATKTMDLYTKSLNANEGSYEKLLRQQQIAQTELKLMEGTLERNAKGQLVLTDAYQAQAVKVKEAKDALITFDQGISDGRSNVGNYTKSILEAAEKSGVFGEALSKVGQVYRGVKEASELAREGIEMANKGITVGIQAVKQYFTASNPGQDVTETFTTIGGAAKEVTAETEKATVATEVYGATTKVASETAVTGFTTVKIALASIGIGVLLIAIAALVNYFKKSEAAGEALERVFAGIGGVIDFLTDQLAQLGKFMVEAFNNPKQALMDFVGFLKDQVVNRITAVIGILKSLATLDFKGFIDSNLQLATGVQDVTKKVGGMADAMAKAAKEAANLEKQQQELDDKVRANSIEINNNNNTIQKGLKLSKDATLSLKDRTEALAKAGDAEARNVELNAANAQKQVELDVKKILSGKQLSDQQKARFTELATSQKTLNALQQQELDNLQELALVSDDELQKIVDSTNAKNNIVAEATETRLLIQKRENKFAQDELKRSINAEIGIIDAGVKLKELAGEKDFQSRREAERKKTQETLLNEELTEKERQRIRKEGMVALAEIDQAEKEFRQGLEKQIRDITIDGIKDARAREIAQEGAALQDKLSAIKGNSDLENQLREDLKRQSVEKLLEIDRKTSAQALQQTIEAENKRNTKTLEAVASGYQEKETELKLQLSKGLITQSEFDQQALELTAKRLLDERNLIEDQKATKQGLIDSTYQVELAKLTTKLETQAITQAQFDEQVTELDKTKKDNQLLIEDEYNSAIAAKDQQLADQRVAAEIAKNNALVANATLRRDAMKAIDQAQIETEKAVFAGIKSVLQAAGKDNKEFGVVMKGIALAELAINLQRELTANRAAGAAQSILLAAVPGGPALAAAQTEALNTKSIIASVLSAATIVAQKFGEGGQSGNGEPISILEALSYNPEFVGSIERGGRANSPILGLIGEKGPEEIFPTSMLRDPVTGPMIGRLAELRDTGRVMPFVDGGITSQALAQSTSVALTPEDFTNAMNQVKIVTIVQDVREGVSNQVMYEDRANHR